MPRANLQTTQDFVIKRNNLSQSKINIQQVIVIWGVIAFFVTLLTLLFWDGWQVPIEALLEGSSYLGLWILISLVCLYFIKKWSFSVVLGKGIDLLEIPVYLSFTGLVLISLFGIAPYLDRSYLISLVDTPRDLPSGLLLIGVGFLAMWSGYGLTVAALKTHAVQRRVHPASGLNFDNPVFYRVISLYLFIVILKLVLFRNATDGLTNLGFLRQPVMFLLDLSWLLVALFIMQTILGRWPRWIFAVVMILEIFIVVLSGWSSSLLKIVFLLIASFAYIGKRVSYPLLLVFCLVGFILTPVTRSMRNADFSSPDAVINTLVTSTDKYWRNNTEGTSLNQELLIGRQSGTAQLPGLILRLTPSIIPYRPVTELLSIPISFIPRVLWPDKLEAGKKGSDFSEEYLGTFGHGSAATTMAGSAYMYGGWIVVILMMGLAGIVFAITYYLIMVPALNSRQVGLFALYAGLVMVNFHLGEGDIAGLWQGLVQRTVIFFCCLVALCIRNR